MGANSSNLSDALHIITFPSCDQFLIWMQIRDLLKHVILCSAINTILSSSELSMKQHNRETRQHTSRIHVKDICRVLMASIESPVSG